MINEEIHNETFGSVIKTARKTKGITIRELAKRIDISHPYLSQLENGHNNKPSTSIILKLSHELDVSFSYLILLSGVSFGAHEEISKRLVKFFKNTNSNVLNNLNSFDDFINKIQDPNFELHPISDEFSKEDELKTVYDLLLLLREIEQTSKGFVLLNLNNERTELVRLLEKGNVDKNSLQYLLITNDNVEVNGRKLSVREKMKLIEIAEIIFDY